MSHGTLLNIYTFISIILLVVKLPSCSMIIEDDDNYKVSANPGEHIPGSMYEAFQARLGKLGQPVVMSPEKLNAELQSSSLYDEYKKELDQITNMELNDKTSGSEKFLRWAQDQPMHYRTETTPAISHKRQSPIDYDDDILNGHGHYDCVYEEFKKRLDHLKSTFTGTNKESFMKYDLKKQEPNVNMDTALNSFVDFQGLNLPPASADVANTKIVDKEKEDLEEFQNEVKQKVLKKRSQFQEDPMCVGSMYEEFQRRLEDHSSDLALQPDTSSDQDLQKYNDDSPIYSKPDLYEIRRIQNSLQPTDIREKFYEEYRKNQHRTRAELSGKATDWSERDTQNFEPHESHQTKYKAKKSIPNERSYAEESLYPSVLTKALESSLNPYTGLKPKSLLTTAAQNMNTTPLDLAQRLTNPADLRSPQNNNNVNVQDMVQKYIESTASAPVQTPSYAPNIKEILEKVFSKLESLQAEKTGIVEETNPEPDLPDGAPCEVIGSWNSLKTGLCFEVRTANKTEHTLSSAERNNTLLTIEVVEHVPEREHSLIDCDWRFMGSAVKILGGPLFIYSQSPQGREIATFTGYCRNCGGIDTIFGSWTVLHPSNDCQDITASVDNKRDIMRRNGMVEKRKERYKDYLYNNSKKLHGSSFRKRRRHRN